MATITSEMVTEYFSQMNLRRPAFMYLDEFVIPMYLNSVDAKRWLAKIDRVSNVPVGSQMFELSCGDYYKFSVKNFVEQHYKRDWKEFHKATLEMNGVKVDD